MSTLLTIMAISMKISLFRMITRIGRHPPDRCVVAGREYANSVLYPRCICAMTIPAWMYIIPLSLYHCMLSYLHTSDVQMHSS